MQAVILAGGEGTRLRPLTYRTPKPVIPLANRPFISYMLEWLGRHGVDQVVMACGFGSDGVRAVLGDGDGGVTIRYVIEPDARGTGGAVKFAQELLDERFLVLNGDVLTDFDLMRVIEFHERAGAKATLSLIGVGDPSAYGLVRTRDDRSISDFLEKPEPDQIDGDEINAGAYVIEREVVEAMPGNRAVSFEHEVFPGLIGNGLYGVRVDGYWLDIGTPDRYLQATRDILAKAVETSVEPTDDRRLAAPSLLGEDCELADGARVGPMACLGDRCLVGSGARVERAVLHDGVTVGADAVVRDSIVGPGATVGSDALVEAETVIGAAESVGAGERLAGSRVGTVWVTEPGQPN